MALTAAQKEICEEWVEAHLNKWQLLNRGKWTYRFHEKTLVRYIAEVTVREDLMEILLEYLASDDCRATLSLYDQRLPPEWTPVRAWYEISNKAAGNVAGVRLYHALTMNPEGEADGPYLVEDGCAYKVSLFYYWKVAAPPAVPKSASGVSYRLSLQRDTETGLYNCVIEKRERVQQDVAEYLMSRTVYADVSEEYHLGVRQEKVESTGRKASVANGRKVRRKISKNPDCTSDVHNTIEQELKAPGSSESVAVSLTGTTRTTVNRNMPTKAPTDDLDIGDRVENTRTEGGLWNQVVTTRVRKAIAWLSERCRWSVFAHSHGRTVVQGEDPGFTHVKKASGGVITEEHVSRTADGSFQRTTNVTTEETVPGASESVRVGLEGTVVTTVNRAMPEKAPTEGLGIGDTVENSETEGGRWNQTIRRLLNRVTRKISDSCRKTIFHHHHATAKVQGSDPGFTHVEEASGGVIHSKSASLTPEGGWRVNDDTTVEKPVAASSRTVRMTLHGLEERVEDRHQQKPHDDPQEIGEVITNMKTDGGLWNRVRTRLIRALMCKVGESCWQDYFTHHHSTTRVEKELLDTETAFEKGRIVDKRGSLNGDGSASNTVTATVAKPSIHRYHYRRNDDAIVHVVKYRNQPDEWNGYPDGAVGLTVNDSVNAFELHDGVVSWLSNAPTGTWLANDLKFIRHGARVDLTEVRYNRRLRRWEHLNFGYIQIHRIRGDAYTDYLSDRDKANPAREDSGVLAVWLVSGPYADRDGNLLAEWEWAEFTNVKGNSWQKCDANCKHPRRTVSRNDAVAEAMNFIGPAGGGVRDDAANGRLADAIEGFALAFGVQTPAPGDMKRGGWNGR